MKSNIIKAVTALCLVLCLFQCSRPKSSNQKSVTLSESDIMSAGVVDDYIEAGISEQNKSAGKKKFLKAVDLFRNKKNAEASIAFFKQSLMLFPNAKTYYEFGNAYLELKNYGKALDAFNMAMGLDYNPVSRLHYNRACCYSRIGDINTALGCLEEALVAGYDNLKHIQTDKDLANLRKHERFQALIISHLKEGDERQNELFQLFTASFNNQDLPYEITKDEATIFDYNHTISFDYAEFIKGMEDSRFSRDVTNEYSFVGRLPLKDSIITLVYSTIETMADTLAPVHTRLVNFTLGGKFLDELEVACYCSPVQFSTCNISNAENIMVNRFEQVWIKNPITEGYEGNEVESIRPVGTLLYKINAEGKFVKNSGMAAAPSDTASVQNN